MQSFIPYLKWRWRALLRLSISMSMGIVFFLSSANLALAETISLSCSSNVGDGYVRLVWLNLDKGEVQHVIGLPKSAYAPGNPVADALYRAKNGELQTYPLSVTGDAYKWTAVSGMNSAKMQIVINRMTGLLSGPDFSEQCSRSGIDPPAPKF